MRTVIQRVTEASVSIDNKIKSKIGKGFMVLVGFEESDSIKDLEWMAKKIVNLRVFDDEKGVMNCSILDKDGDLLVISQFTLHALTAKGNRPSYIRAARPEIAKPLYDEFLTILTNMMDKEIGSGIFGADMKVALINDGPVTICMDTAHKE